MSVRTLRYYDEIGLLRPVWVDQSTGYRWYEAEQLRRLHRVLALRDLGVRLVEIGVLLDDQLTVQELRGILSLRRAEAHDRLAAEAERLARVEARLAQLEEREMSDYDMVVKSKLPMYAYPVESVRRAAYLAMRLFDVLDRLEAAGVDVTADEVARIADASHQIAAAAIARHRTDRAGE